MTSDIKPPDNGNFPEDPFVEGVIGMLDAIAAKVGSLDLHTKGLNLSRDYTPAMALLTVHDRHENLLLGVKIIPQRAALSRTGNPRQINSLDVFYADKKVNYGETPWETLRRDNQEMIPAVKSELEERAVLIFDEWKKSLTPKDLAAIPASVPAHRRPAAESGRIRDAGVKAEPDRAKPHRAESPAIQSPGNGSDDFVRFVRQGSTKPPGANETKPIAKSDELSWLDDPSLGDPEVVQLDGPSWTHPMFRRPSL